MVKEGKEGKEVDYIDDFPLCHDLCRRDEESGENVENSGKKVSTKVQCHPTSAPTTAQHYQDARRRRRHGETPSKDRMPQKANPGTKRANLRFQLRQCTSQLCTTSIQCSNKYPGSPRRCYLYDYHRQATRRISEVS